MPGRGLALLSLDGGGIRGLSSLIILKQVLENVAIENDWDEAPKPCDYFNMICGTSTGGLIAIMLGRLEMAIDECMKAYIELSSNIFVKRHLPVSIKRKGSGKIRFKRVGTICQDNTEEERTCLRTPY